MEKFIVLFKEGEIPPSPNELEHSLKDQIRYIRILEDRGVLKVKKAIEDGMKMSEIEQFLFPHKTFAYIIVELDDINPVLEIIKESMIQQSVVDIEVFRIVNYFN